VTGARRAGASPGGVNGKPGSQGAARVQAREEERIRLAAELHDGPIQRLTGAAYTADLSRRRLARADMDGGQQLLDSLEDDIRGEVAALRRVMVELRPPALDEWGLSAALSDYAKTFEEQTGIACTVQPTSRAGSPVPRRRCCTGSPRRPSPTSSSTPGPTTPG
jgi:signal transduction histidine kinase